MAQWPKTLLASIVISCSISVPYLLYFNIDSPSLPAKPLPPKKEKSSATRSQEALLIDSILSIVQSYYVDQGRVKTANLIEQLLDSIDQTDRVRFTMGEVKGEPGCTEVCINPKLQIDGVSYDLPSGDLSYVKLLEVIEAVAGIIDQSTIAQLLAASIGDQYEGLPTILNLLLSSLDAHSSLMSPDEYLELRQGTEGSFGGLGVLVGIRDNLLTVIKPIPESPAMRIGIKRHDRILGINGTNTFGSSLDNLVEYMRGDPGSEVRLTMLREGLPSPFDINITREIIQVDSVTTEMHALPKGGKVLHLAIESFSSRTSREVMIALKKAKLEFGAELAGLVIDLRSNPGGLLDQAVQVADVFLDSGIIVSTKGRRNEIEAASRGFDETELPLVILVNADSASASEIVAGALQDHDRAIILGQPTFGKGSVQTIFELPQEMALKLTIARYYTPRGRSIQNVGIVPDVWVHPISLSEENRNLLGQFRYKNEQFLRHRLEVQDGSEPRVDATIKSYFLSKSSAQTVFDDQERDQDRELNLALQVFSAVAEQYPQGTPEGLRRATHWLAVAAKPLKDTLTELENEATDWLAKEANVSWQKAPVSHHEPKLSLAVEPVTSPSPREQHFKWRIKNLDSEAVDRISVYVRSEATGFETVEVLVGKFNAGETKEGVLKVKLPPTGIQRIIARVGVARDAWPLIAPTTDLTLQVKQATTNQLTFECSMLDSDKSAIPGVLESLEDASLEVWVENSGKETAENLLITVSDLSAGQVRIENEAVAIAKLGAGERRRVTIAIKGGDYLYRDEVGIGVSMESSNSGEPQHKYFGISAKSNYEAASVLRTLGH